MSTITLPNIRVGSDLQVRVRLKDGGVAIDWSTLANIRAHIYSDAQRALAGRCNVSIDEEDSTILVCQYAANKMQYLGVNRVIVQCKYLGEVKTYDKPAFTFVRWTSDQEGEQITIDDPDVDVEISVEDVSSSILQEAVDAAFDAADRANDAAAAAEHMVDIHTGPEGKSAYEVAVEEGYTGTEEEWLASLKGPVGETPDISIGTVTTVEPGTPAAASMSGTPEAPVLNLSIPKGAVGATPNFTVGTVTTGQPGTPVVITITGTDEAPVLNVTIPQGLKGDTGVSADYPITIHNGLDSDATDEALAAAQGKVLKDELTQLEQEIKEKYEYCIEDAINNQIQFLNIENESAAKSGGLYLYQIQADYTAVYFKDSAANSIGIFNIVAGQVASKPTPQYGKITIVLKPSYQNATSSLNHYNIGDLSYYTYSEQQVNNNIGEIQRELNEDYVKIDKTYNIFNPVTQGYVNIQNTISDGDTPAYVTSDWIELKQGQRIILSANNAQVIRIYAGTDKLPTTSGGHRVDYISAYQGVYNGRYYAEYRATVDCYVRASTVRVGEPMLEITENQYPRPYIEYKYQLPSNLNFTLPQMGGNIWNGKRVLCIGDSLTAAGIWQQKLSENLGLIVSTHALGGIGFPQMLDGVTVGDETLPPLAQSDVINKDLIIVYGGYNHRGGVVGQPGDLYPTQETTIGALQYLINGIYSLLSAAGNLKCRLVVICPHCAGAYSYIPYNWNEEYPVGSGRTGETVANGIIECARYNRIASFDLFHNSGINQNTWSVFSASPTPTTGGTVNDQLHLNPTVGYPYLGDRIADWVKTI